MNREDWEDQARRERLYAKKPEITVIEVDRFDRVYQCCDCGAHSFVSAKAIKHHATCVPGDSARWAKHYSEAEDTP